MRIFYNLFCCFGDGDGGDGVGEYCVEGWREEYFELWLEVVYLGV